MTIVIAVLTLIAGAVAGLAVGLNRGRAMGVSEAEGRAATELEAARFSAEQARQATSEALRTGLSELLEANERLQRQLTEQNAVATGHQQKTVHDLVKPIDDQLTTLKATLERIQTERANETGKLDQQLRNLLDSTQKLNDDTKVLSSALRDTRVRGSWGELQLRRVVELADMMRYCSFEEQVHLSGDDGAMRPDLIVKLPQSRVILVDSKVPLNSYLDAMNCDDPEQQAKFLDEHARAVEKHVNTLRDKNYGAAHPGSLGFVVMFVPGDTFLNEAYRVRPSLMAESVERGVLLTTPTALIGLLKAIEAGWRQEQLAENAEEIRRLGEDLLSRLGVFVDHLAKVGTNLGRATESYNKAVNSMQTRLLPAARRFEETGVRSDKDLDAAKTQTTAPVLTTDDRLELESGDADPDPMPPLPTEQ
jgi:DNA recombination protein RmuC